MNQYLLYIRVLHKFAADSGSLDELGSCTNYADKFFHVIHGGFNDISGKYKK